MSHPHSPGFTPPILGTDIVSSAGAGLLSAQEAGAAVPVADAAVPTADVALLTADVTLLEARPSDLGILPAPLMRRVGAGILDLAVLGVLAAGVVAAAGELGTAAGPGSIGRLVDAPVGAWCGGILGVYLLVSLVCRSRRGQSLGTAAMGLRVLTVDSVTPPEIWRFFRCRAVDIRRGLDPLDSVALAAARRSFDLSCIDTREHLVRLGSWDRPFDGQLLDARSYAAVVGHAGWASPEGRAA